MSSLSNCVRFLVVSVLLTAPMLAQSAPVTSPLADTAAYVASQFGVSFKVDPKIAPMFGDLNGDGIEDLVLVGTSSSPLVSQEQFRYKVEDPYDAYYGVGDPRITTQFGLHFDGSSRCLMIVLNWRQPELKSKRVSKYVLINTPFERVSIVNLRLKKKDMQAIEAVDRTTLHALLFWDGRRWRWDAKGMDSDEEFFRSLQQK